MEQWLGMGTLWLEGPEGCGNRHSIMPGLQKNPGCETLRNAGTLLLDGVRVPWAPLPCLIYLQCLHLIFYMFYFFSLQKRQILVTVIEICLPLLFAAILIALRHRVHSVSHPNATVYPPESVDDLPGFFYRRHPGNPWELAYVPSNSSAVRSIAEVVERALPISIRGEQGPGAAASTPETGTHFFSDKS